MLSMSDTIADLAAALAEANGQVENATKNKINPHFKSTYADLSEVINNVRPIFAKHGLSIVQCPNVTEGTLTVETLLLHKTGQWIKSSVSCRLANESPQTIGSGVTYLRRYSMAALACIAQEDDDGESAQPKNGSKQAKPGPTRFEMALKAIDEALVKKDQPRLASLRQTILDRVTDGTFSTEQGEELLSKCGVSDA